ncbi:DinB family protein [Paenibacillus sp. NPDC056579]|uniref:DinB family protein n=1 Tax=Paenibacillus sp. NPDC056579 TaxID=3345871 RepID=UPI0036AFDB20
MSETALPSIRTYRDTSALIKERVAGLTEEQLEWKPAPDKWSIKEVAAHLVDSSLVHSVRIRKIVAESAPPLLQYDQDAWVTTSKANQTSLDDILTAFEAILAYNVLFYERLTVQDWLKKGINSDKEISVSDLFHGFIKHVNTHLTQIERTRAALPAIAVT